MLAEIAHFAGGQGVGGSNPLAPTINSNIINMLKMLGSGPSMAAHAPKAAELRIAAQKSPPKSPPDVPRAFSRAPSRKPHFPRSRRFSSASTASRMKAAFPSGPPKMSAMRRLVPAGNLVEMNSPSLIWLVILMTIGMGSR